MNNTVSIAIKVAIFAIIAILGIVYIFNRSPVEDLGAYEKQEMVKPNRGRSMLDQFFSTSESNGGDGGGDDVSLTGKSGRYDEVRIGKDLEE